MSCQRLRILTYTWHVGHQYELFKLPHDFFLYRNEYSNQWQERIRPLPRSAEMIDRLDRLDFDLAILPFDEHVLTPQVALSPMPAHWGRNFEWLLDWCREHDLPVIGLCHGTVPRIGRYRPEHPLPEADEIDVDVKQALVEQLRGCYVVCNSRQAHEEWGFDGRAIIHGFDPDEYPIGRRTEGVLTISGNLYTNGRYQGWDVFSECARAFPIDLLGGDRNRGSVSEGLRINRVRVKRPRMLPGQRFFRAGRVAWGRRTFVNYKRLIGEHAVYLNTTRFSPMPRARAEAMLCGIAVVSTGHYDFDRFVDHGETGFIFRRAAEAIDLLRELLGSPSLAREIGLRGREAACDFFHISRYLAEWEETLERRIA